MLYAEKGFQQITVNPLQDVLKYFNSDCQKESIVFGCQVGTRIDITGAMLNTGIQRQKQNINTQTILKANKLILKIIG